MMSASVSPGILIRILLKRSSTRKMFWRAAAVIVPLLAVMVAVPLKTDLFKSKVESSSLNPLAKAEFESNKAAVDSNIPEVAIRVEEAIPQPLMPETAVPAVVEKENYLYYYRKL